MQSKLIAVLIVCLAIFGEARGQAPPAAPQNFSDQPRPVETPYFEFFWTEADGTVQLPQAVMEHFGQTVGRIELDFTPRLLFSTGDSLRLLNIPGHLGIWVWNDGIHGEWFDRQDNRRLFRARWGLPANGVESRVVISWDDAGYAVIIDDVLRIHDWQVLPTAVYPDPGVLAGGVYGSRVDGSQPANGSFALRAYDLARSYDACAVDVVGTINESVPTDNLGSWSQGIDPDCFPGNVPLQWVNATTYEDDTDLPLAEIASISIYDAPSGIEIVSVPPDPPQHVLVNVASGMRCYYATTVATNGQESVPSNETCKVVP